ncbi:AAA family ATPase [Methylomonas sp. EFPC1]|uniref:AAA family ATPase n=1 Tax=unclassified Methylomonas TaxID=2608980 RepID=UPI00051C4300|nr:MULTISPECIES: AAA family ATPase [unclassified Methylomonas]QBC26766.1 AAA family ATPase [Methylomonas sp. LW13]QSB02628.1 AAA family ATPase [Methylomonas sp. EFPC1]
MKINKLNLSNFRCFENYEIDFSDRFTLLIGDNGSGKTAVLDALKLAINPFILGLKDFLHVEYGLKADCGAISDYDKRYEFSTLGQTLIKQAISPTSVYLKGILNNCKIDWTLTSNLDSISSLLEPIVSFAAELNASDSKTVFPVICNYGTARLSADTLENIDTSGPSSRLIGYRYCLDPFVNLKQLFSWFKKQEIIFLQKQEPQHVLEAVREAIVAMIPDAKRAWWAFEWDEILIEMVIQGKNQTIPFHLLSDGYRNMIGMVADIAYRMATLNPQLEADVIKQTEGIVLIDEIDLHLHPKWQREVVGRLLKTFPKVQFVASSHSPFIIQSLYGREDCLLWDLEKAQPVAIESESIEDIAEDQQHVEIPQKSKRYLDMMEAAEAYYRKLHEVNNESDMEVMQLRSKLDELSIPFSDDPAFAAQLKFERDSVLASKDK